MTELVIALGGEEILRILPCIERAFAASVALSDGPDGVAPAWPVPIVDDGTDTWPCVRARSSWRAARRMRRIAIARSGTAPGAPRPPEGGVRRLPCLRRAPLDSHPLTANRLAKTAVLRRVMSCAREVVAAKCVIVLAERRARAWSGLRALAPRVWVIGYDYEVVPRRVEHGVSDERVLAEFTARALSVHAVEITA